MCVEEVCVLGLVNHGFDVVFGLMDDGKVKHPIGTGGNMETCYSTHATHRNLQIHTNTSDYAHRLHHTVSVETQKSKKAGFI